MLGGDDLRAAAMFAPLAHAAGPARAPPALAPALPTPPNPAPPPHAFPPSDPATHERSRSAPPHNAPLCGELSNRGGRDFFRCTLDGRLFDLDATLDVSEAEVREWAVYPGKPSDAPADAASRKAGNRSVFEHAVNVQAAKFVLLNPALRRERKFVRCRILEAYRNSHPEFMSRRAKQRMRMRSGGRKKAPDPGSPGSASDGTASPSFGWLASPSFGWSSASGSSSFETMAAFDSAPAPQRFPALQELGIGGVHCSYPASTARDIPLFFPPVIDLAPMPGPSSPAPPRLPNLEVLAEIAVQLLPEACAGCGL
ncbi:hypothetical protein DFJ74DRAFT_774674 [Hyaloraphidium curvatum]|nr:hypothetical protein DFJ74DRAFT_774674 [Hyaloraphidium curvatum]